MVSFKEDNNRYNLWKVKDCLPDWRAVFYVVEIFECGSDLYTDIWHDDFRGLL